MHTQKGDIVCEVVQRILKTIDDGHGFIEEISDWYKIKKTVFYRNLFRMIVLFRKKLDVTHFSHDSCQVVALAIYVKVS